MITVTITELGRDRKVFTSRHRTSDEAEAIHRAVTRVWGRGAGFWCDSGLADLGRFGQIIRPLPRALGGGSTCVTGRVHVEAAS